LLYPAELRAQKTGKIAFADGFAFSRCYSTVNPVKQKKQAKHRKERCFKIVHHEPALLCQRRWRTAKRFGRLGTSHFRVAQAQRVTFAPLPAKRTHIIIFVATDS
jgi:hypothetical protein